MFECETSKLEPDNHWYLYALCQAVFNGEQCARSETEFPHNDIVNEEFMYEKHPFVPPTEPLVWGENAHRANICPGSNYHYNQDPDEYRQCFCPCHWGSYYVNIYLIGQGYGGPEEGGWYYEYGEPYGSIPCDSYKEALEYQAKMREKYPITKNRFSSLGGDDYSVVVEKHFATSYPEVIPHYE